MTKLFELQTAVYNKLISNVETMAAINGVFDYVPEKTPFPYVVLGAVVSQPYRTKTTDGERITLEIDIYSDGKGKKETINIMNLIEAALGDSFAIDGAFLIDHEVINREAKEEVNDLYHGSVVFQFILDME